MTQNVLTYLANQETARSNLAKEQETYRSNLAKESETARSNLAKEAETQRYNTGYLQELNRSNVRKENISAFEAQDRQRANQANEAIDLLSQRNRGLELSETRRHNTEMESQGVTKLTQEADRLGLSEREVLVKELESKLKGINLGKGIVNDIANVVFRLIAVATN